MTFYKKISRDINVNGKKRKDLPLNAEIFSYDEQVAKFVLTLINDIDEIDLSGAEVLAIMEYTVDGVGGSVEAISGIESLNENSIYFIVPEKLRGFEGSVTAGVYVNLSSGEKIDIQNLKFKMSRSLVDSTSGPAADFYFESFDDVLVKVKAAGDKAITDINSEAQRVSAHANQKISEYDAKFAQSDQKMSQLQNSQTALDSKLTETQQKITDADVYTKSESDANVIDNIAGTETATLKKELSVNGTEATGARDDNGTLIPFAQDDYDKIAGADTHVRSETLINGRGAEIQFDFNVIGTLEAKYPALFKGLITFSEKIAKFKNIQRKITSVGVFRGGGIDSTSGTPLNQATIYIRSNASGGAWGMVKNNGGNIATLSRDFTSAHVDAMTSEGKYIFYIASRKNNHTDSGAISDGVTPAWVEVKDIRLTIELEVNGRTIIESMIAQYHRENVQPQITDLAARVLALETKLNQ